MLLYVPYVIMSILALFFGQLAYHINRKIPPLVNEEITYKQFFIELKKDFKLDIKYSIIFLIFFNMLIYFLGNNYLSYVYAITIFSLSVVFSVDYRFQLIPDETHLVILFAGFIHLLFNLNLWWDYLLGALIGGAIFYSINLIALLILKKEGMGFGDVKLMTALGFLFGIKYILVVTLVSFFVGAVIGGGILIFNKITKKDSDGYIAFGPFIVIAAILLMFVNADYIIEIYINFCYALGMKMSDVIYFFIEKFS